MNRPVNISFALNGFIATVGCQTLVFNDLDELLGNLRSYLQDPEATETAMRKNALNTKITLGSQPEEIVCTGRRNAGVVASPPIPWPTEAQGGQVIGNPTGYAQGAGCDSRG